MGQKTDVSDNGSGHLRRAGGISYRLKRDLKQSFGFGASIFDLTKKFGRKRGAITSRLEKLGLI